MAALNAELTVRLDASASIGSLQGSVTGALGDFDAVTMPDLTADFSAAQGHGDGIDLSAITQGVEQVFDSLGPILENLPGASDAMEPITSAIELATELADLNLPNSVTDFASNLEIQLSSSGDFLSKLNTLSELLQGNSSWTAAQDLVGNLASLSGSQLTLDDFKVPNLLPAVQAVAPLIGNLMSLQHRLSEGGELATVIKAQLDGDKITAIIAEIETNLGLTNEVPLTQLIRDLDVTDSVKVAEAKLAISETAISVAVLNRSIAEGMAFGEATLVELNPSVLTAAIAPPSKRIDISALTIPAGVVNVPPLD